MLLKILVTGRKKEFRHKIRILVRVNDIGRTPYRTMHSDIPMLPAHQYGENPLLIKERLGYERYRPRWEPTDIYIPTPT